jgi:hypothetical protein
MLLLDNYFITNKLLGLRCITYTTNSHNSKIFLFLKTQNLDLMNESNSTRFSTLIKLFSLVLVLFVGTMTTTMAQTPSCACKGSIQVSVDDNCEAVISAEMLLANGSTCGGISAAEVTLMKTPTGGIIDSGTGQAELIDGQLYIGKTIYAKVATTNGSNSCWTTINVEDKFKPTWESTEPDTCVVTCPSIGSFIPVAFDNCHTPRVYQVAEEIVVNECDNPTLFLGPDTLKMIKRSYRAVDESGNVSETTCDVVFFVVALDVDDIVGIKNVELECDANYAKLPNGNPSPVDITVNGVTRPGTGYPGLSPWMRVQSGAGVADVIIPTNSLKLTGGTTGLGGGATTGAQVCITVEATGTMKFDWQAQMLGSMPPPGNYNGDHAQYLVNGVVTNLTVGGTGSGATPQSGANVLVPVVKGDQFCFRVRTNNIERWTELNVTNISGPIPANVGLTPNTEHCNIYVTYEDTNFPAIKCVKKIMRKWQILEWSCESRISEFYQIIEIIDSKGPVVTDLNTPVTASTNGHTCEGIYKLQKPTLTDNCSTNLTYDVTYDGGFIKGIKLSDADRYIPLPLGCSEIKYTAFDECHNQTDYFVSVRVEDNTPPVAICDQNTTIGLTLEGKAWVPATSFDDGSYDDCDLAKMLVRRMTFGECVDCKTPEFPGFTHLGEFVNEGKTRPHYYYISKHRATPEVAIKTAAAMGGYVVALNNSAEDTWLYGKVGEWNLDEDYLIGLRDQKQKGLFTWLSDESSTYRNWNTGNPKDVLDGHNDYNYVRVLDRNGRWEDFGTDRCEEGEYLYVVEITDPCSFSSYAMFCCSDVGVNTMVQFRVIDKSGNWNDCMVNALVQDKLPPSITCPPHYTITCNDYFDTEDLRATFGWPTTYDNCNPATIVEKANIDLSSCRIGTITREFTATDAGGRTAKCTQIITVNGRKTPFEMTADRWPADRTIEGCENPNDPAFGPDFLGRPDLTADNICSLVGAQYEDQIFTFNNNTGDACFKILRYWTVIDWCQSYPVTGGGFEYRTWEHTQVIKVYDPVKPVITSSCAPKSVCTYDPTCKDGYIELIATATDVCTDILRYYVKVYPNNGSSFDPRFSKSGFATVVGQSRVNTADASGNYPIGTHKIEWAFEDRCGNLTKCDQLFTISNCKAPTPYCINGLASSLMPMDTDNDGIADSGMVEIWAKDFDNGSFHPCGYDVLHSFAPITLDAQKRPVLVMSRAFTCDDLGINNLNVYVGVLTPSGELVQDFCSTFITIQDNNDVCDEDGNKYVVQGDIMTETNVAVKDVEVFLQGGEMNVITGVNGTYNFADVPFGGSYVVNPSKNDDPLNGVSTLDLVMIQRHILGIEKLNTPAKLIAADVNNDKKISASDLTELRKLILGVINEFPSNNSWKFFDKSYNFLDVETAHTEALPNTYTIENIKSDMVVNFTAVKIGDVNGNVKANASEGVTEARSAHKLALNTDDQKFTAGETIEVPISVAQNSEITGFQFTVNFDANMFSLVAINSQMTGVTDNNFGFTKLANGMVTVSYNKEQKIDLAEGDNVVTLTLKAKDNGNVANALWLDSAITKAEAYTSDLEVMNVDFMVNNRTSESAMLYQNTPNPFKTITTIGFDLPEASDATLTVFDVTGKTLKVINSTFNKGYNSVEINKNEIGSVGVVYYTLEAGSFKATKKMVVIE